MNSGSRATTISRRPPGALVYPSRVNLQLTLERWPDLVFREARSTWRRRLERP
jgi:hypothetical protein